MHTVGVDIVEISRIAQTLERWGNRFLQRVYTVREQEYCRGRVAQLASRFAAKEAVMKALGTGRRGLNWREIEVVRRPGGPPSVQLEGRASEVAKRMAVSQVALSLSHSSEYAIASVVMEKGDPS